MQIELVKISVATLGGQEVRAVDARDLHASFEVGKCFVTWVKDRIEQYGFEKGRDFEVFTGESLSIGGRPRSIYIITLDMAKELAMVERTAKGKRVRQYFIDCERRLHGPQQVDSDSNNEFIRCIGAKSTKISEFDGCVYFIAAGNSYVKIGKSSGDAGKRLKYMQVCCPLPMRILAKIPGDLKLEMAMHKRFQEYSVHGEWFRLEGKLASFIESVSNQLAENWACGYLSQKQNGECHAE